MKTILVVEDNHEILENVREILILSNYKVLTAENGIIGSEKAIEFIPDLIISDIMMPGLDGMGLLHVLRRNPKTEHIPIIFLTAKNEQQDFRNAMQSGADDFLIKPFGGDELLKTVEQRLKRVELLQKHNDGIDGIKELLTIINDEDENLETLKKGHDAVYYQKKQMIYREGNMPHFLYYIQKGKVRTYKVHDDGKQLVMGLYNEGDFLGYIALLEEGPYKEMAEAIENTELILIPRKDFEKLVHKNVTVANKLIKMLAKNITEHEQQLLGIAYNTLRKKVAVALIKMQNKFQTDKKEPFYIDISREELAAIAGTATESLIRTLSDFKIEKLIDIKKDNKIEIINLKKLGSL